MNRPKIISISGIDGSGKTTQINYLKEYFDSLNLKSEILKVKYLPFHKMKNLSLTTDDLRMLMAKDFVDYYNKRIKELSDYDYLLCDRSKACLLAYGLSYGLKNPDNIWDLLKETQDPDLLFYFDIDPLLSIERISKNRTEFEEDETIENLKRTRMYYSRVFNDYDFNPVCIDASEQEEEITKKLVLSIKKLN
ncbi:MAG: hypothetical protein IJH20_00780 [Bacilli bacterium]|nr:hypothetical protein [Bacilli bacterium]